MIQLTIFVVPRYHTEVAYDPSTEEQFTLAIQNNRDHFKGEARKAYGKASNYAVEHFPAASALRLGVELNYAVFFVSVLDDVEHGIRMAQRAYDAGLESLADPNYEPDDFDAETGADVMNALKSNILNWFDTI